MYIGFIIWVLPTIAVVSALIYLPIWLVGRRSGKKPFIRHLARYALVGYCVSLIYLTILWYYPNLTFDPGYYSLNLTPFVWLSETYAMGQERMLEQLAYNIGMFVPYGLLLPVVFKKMRSILKTGGVALATTLFIETFQYFIGRSADIDDVITNLVGGLIGYLLFMLFDKLFGKHGWWRRATGKQGLQR